MFDKAAKAVLLSIGLSMAFSSLGKEQQIITPTRLGSSPFQGKFLAGFPASMKTKYRRKKTACRRYMREGRWDLFSQKNCQRYFG